MFLHVQDGSSGPVAISQASHAWLAWQVAQHWGNRRFVRPAPRSEVLAAILLHDVGWTEFDMDPGVDTDGHPISFDRMPVGEHLDIWRESVARAGMFSSYAGLLVATHFASLVERKTSYHLKNEDTTGGRASEAFRAEIERLQASWRESLRLDARYQPYLEGDAWEANAALLEACDRISVYLCGALGSPFEVIAKTPSGSSETVVFQRIEDSSWRVRPWPLEGDRLRLQVEGRRLTAARFSSGEDLRKALSRAPIRRLSFTLVRPSAG
jgi:hypothetical protein